MSAKLLFEVNGTTLRPDECSWFLFAPCGCMAGATLIEHGDGTFLATDEDAWTSMYENAGLRDRTKADGFRMELAERARIVEMNGSCSHTPKWGRETAAVPDGHVWARQKSLRGDGRRKHFVPTEHVEMRDGPTRGPGEVSALCGRAKTWWWCGDSWFVDEVAPCTRCESQAVASVSGGDGAG